MVDACVRRIRQSERIGPALERMRLQVLGQGNSGVVGVREYDVGGCSMFGIMAGVVQRRAWEARAAVADPEDVPVGGVTVG